MIGGGPSPGHVLPDFAKPSSPLVRGDGGRFLLLRCWVELPPRLAEQENMLVTECKNLVRLVGLTKHAARPLLEGLVADLLPLDSVEDMEAQRAAAD